ncbi:MAG: hypothetical protein L0220_31920 [Acidobacteria bacterium]|nr:hypothetical protein [Acidobacteriota bacterium]
MSATLTSEATTYAPVEPLLKRLRERGIIIPEPDEVRGYLTRYPDAIGVTEKACDLTRSEFAGRAELSLELYRDPEIYDPHLVLYIRQEKYDSDIMEAIERIHDGYEEYMFDIEGWLLVTTDFDRPKEMRNGL